MDSISTIAIDSTNRTAVYFNPNYADGGCCTTSGLVPDPLIWIEEIGSNSGLMMPDGSQSIIDQVGFLTCYRENGQKLYGELCNVFYTGYKNESTPVAISVSPNPFCSEFTVSLPGGHLLPCFLELLTPMGNSVYERTINHDIKVTIPVSNLLSGIYLLRITGSTWNWSSQVVRQ